MYAAQPAAAPKAKARPTGSSSTLGLPSRATPGPGERDPEEVERAARAEHGDRERAEELDGRRQAERDAVDRLVEAGVHEGDRWRRPRSPSAAAAGRPAAGARALSASSRSAAKPTRSQTKRERPDGVERGRSRARRRTGPRTAAPTTRSGAGASPSRRAVKVRSRASARPRGRRLRRRREPRPQHPARRRR